MPLDSIPGGVSGSCSWSLAHTRLGGRGGRGRLSDPKGNLDLGDQGECMKSMIPKLSPEGHLWNRQTRDGGRGGKDPRSRRKSPDKALMRERTVHWRSGSFRLVGMTRAQRRGC